MAKAIRPGNAEEDSLQQRNQPGYDDSFNRYKAVYLGDAVYDKQAGRMVLTDQGRQKLTSQAFRQPQFTPGSDPESPRGEHYIGQSAAFKDFGSPESSYMTRYIQPEVGGDQSTHSRGIQIADPKRNGHYNYSVDDYIARLQREEDAEKRKTPIVRVFDGMQRVVDPFVPRINAEDALADFQPNVEYSDAFLRQEEQKDAWSPNWENGEKTPGKDYVRMMLEYFDPRIQNDEILDEVGIRAGTPSVNWHPEETQITGSEEAAAAAAGTPERERIPDRVTHRGTDLLGGDRTVVKTQATPETDRPEMPAREQYLYPENGSKMRFQSRSPFEDWEKELIDEMNTAYENRDFGRQRELLETYNAGQDAYSRYRYEQGLGEGETPYQGMLDALGSRDPAAFGEARNALAEKGYTDDMLDEQAADWIHQNGGSVREQEAMLQEYLGLSPSDAEATSVLWWWTDSNGKGEADTDANGKLKQDELGSYLKTMEEGGTLSEAQAATIWNDSFPTAKTDYSAWKGKGTKKEKSQVFTDADSNGNNRLTQAELGAYLMQQQAGGMTDEEAAKIWAEEFPSAKTDYAKWKGKQK